MKAFVTWPLLLFVVLLDVVTKRVAEAMLPGVGLTRPFLGETVRFTLVYNPGAAFGLYLGAYSRWIFIVLTTGALIILWRLYRQTMQEDLTRAVAIGLVAAGAIGNLIDRMRNSLGVVDFIDIGFAEHRWPTFNIADMAVSGGAFLLAYVLWGEEQAAPADAAVDPAPADKRTDAREIL
ncbi:MAG: signal peptidase II [Gemmatimonadota bacterium]